MDLALIQAKLPEEVLLLVLGQLAPYQLGRTQCVCKHWRALCERESLWRPACQDAFRMQPAEDVATDLRSQYRFVLCRLLQLHVDLLADCSASDRHARSRTAAKPRCCFSGVLGGRCSWAGRTCALMASMCRATPTSEQVLCCSAAVCTLASLSACTQSK